MANELAAGIETAGGTHQSIIEKNLNGSISNKHIKGAGGFGPNHFQSSFSLQRSHILAGGQNELNQTNPNDISIDAISMAGSYVAKSKLQRARSSGHTKRGANRAIFYGHYTNKLEGEDRDSVTPADSNIKVYIPKEYFKHAGYIKDEGLTEDGRSRISVKTSRQQPRKPQTPFKDRFNEKLEYPTTGAVLSNPS